MKSHLVTAALTVIVTVIINRRNNKQQWTKISESLMKNHNIVFELGRSIGKAEARKTMHHARPIVEDRLYVSHTMN